MIAYIEEVRSSVAAMRKQLTHLTPSLRYLRERRERIDMELFVEDLVRFYKDKLAANGISLYVRTRTTGFSVHMNRGKLTQVFDNLILNAEYWLKESIGAGFIEKGEITITISQPYVQVTDNGRGVEESVEDSLFEPFVTMKRAGEGRGLGCLYAVNSLTPSLVILCFWPTAMTGAEDTYLSLI